MAEVYVRENQMVTAGDLLHRIDPTPFRLAPEQAQAAVDTAQLDISQTHSGYAAKSATVRARRVRRGAGAGK